MRVLIISPAFPPIATAEAFCGGKFVQALMNSGVETRVIFSSDVLRPPKFDESCMWESLNRVSIDIPLALPAASDRVTIPKWKRYWLALRYRTTLWPRWTGTVVAKAAELHTQAAFDLIVSRQGEPVLAIPHLGHVAGYWAASALGLPWVAIVNDPWDFRPFAPEATRRDWTPGMNWRMWWRRILSKADRICFPSDRLRSHCLRGTHRTDGAVVLPHIGAVRKSQNREDGFVIVHAGQLGLGELTGRSAVGLLNGLKELFRMRPAARSRTRLIFVGAEDPHTTQFGTSLGLAENVHSTGWVSYEKSLEYIAQASVCVLIEGDREEGVFLPSKLCDYIAAKKPIMALSPAVGCAADLAEAGGIMRMGPKDTPAIAAALVEMFDAFTERRLQSYAPSDALVSRYQGPRVVADFLNGVRPLIPKAL